MTLVAALQSTGPNARSHAVPVLLGAVLTCLAIQAVLVFRQPVNWDEFRFLADVHLVARGELSDSVQTFHAHFFAWLLWLPGTEVDQILAARLVMLVLETGIAAMIYRCASRFAGVETSLFALLCYLSFSFVLHHGASFRFDPPSTFLLMAAVTILTTMPVRFATAAAVGLLTAVAALITIKSIFYVPTLLALAYWRTTEIEAERRARFVSLAAGGIVGALALALLYFWHQSHIVVGSLDAAHDIVSGSIDKTIGQSTILPRRGELLRSVLESPINWLIVVGAVVTALTGALRAPSSRRVRDWALVSFAAPLATLLFYRNAFPYYYVFMLAPVVVVVAPFAEACLARGRRMIASAVMFAIMLTHALQAFFAGPPILTAQRTVIAAVHSIFPDPVAYLDRCSMIASSRKQGFFMSTWGTEVYRDNGRPLYRDILRDQRPAYVLLNSPILFTALTGEGDDRRLLAEDATVLRAAFIPHWGPIWVAGKRLDVTRTPMRFEILIAGRYTVEADGPVLIDGGRHHPGAVITLSAGAHVAASRLPQRLTLRWGTHLPVPAAAPPVGPLFGDL